MPDDPVPSTRARRSLPEEQRAIARQRILRAARQALAERGLATRMEDVAAAAEVGRRTLFRHFESRDALLAAALSESVRSYGEHIPVPDKGESLEAWLGRCLVSIHRMNAGHGRVYWELALTPDLDGPLAEFAQARRDARHELVRRFGTRAWRLGGGRGRPPSWLLDTTAIHLSTFATEALRGDFDRSPEQTGMVAARSLTAAVRAAVDAQRSSPAVDGKSGRPSGVGAGGRRRGGAP